MTIDTASFASSNLQSGSFDPDTGEMRITFSRGATYLWTEIAESDWLSLKSAFSPWNALRKFGPGVRE